MVFCDFAQRVYSVIGSGSNTSAFARTLLDTIVVYEDEALNPIQELKPSTFKAYYNGTNNITKTAKKINANVETSAFEEYIDSFPDNAVQGLCSLFEEAIPNITPYNASQKLAELFASIIYEAAMAKPKAASKKKTSEETTTSAHDKLTAKILASGEAMAKAWAGAVNGLTEEQEQTAKAKSIPVLKPGLLSDADKGLLCQFKKDVKGLLKYCIDNDPAAQQTKISLADELHSVHRKWQYDLREIEAIAFRQLVIDTTQTMEEYSYYVSDEFLRLIPGTDRLWFRNESAEDGDRLRNVLQPKSHELRLAMAELYRRLYPIPEEAKQDEAEPVEAETVDEESSGAADAAGDGVRTQIINNPTIVNQYGEKNVHIEHVDNLKL
jgi:hypothetical protein